MYNPHDVYVYTQIVNLVNLALGELQPYRRYVLECCDLEGYPLVSMAEDLGVTVGRVRQIRDRARRDLLRTPHGQKLWDLGTDMQMPGWLKNSLPAVA